jgi:hypothetical protein
MLNYLKKFSMEILPSVAATIIGAYIVNHYIATKPNADTAPAAAASIAAKPKANAKSAPEAKPAESTGDVANAPEAGIKAKGISEKGLLERNAAAEKAAVEKPAAEKPVAEKPVAEKPVEKPADKPAETASIPAEPRRHAPVQRDKSVAKLAAPAPVPVVAVPTTAPAVEAAPEERRDANDLARAAIERLRSGNDGAQRPLEAARAPEASRNPEAARIPDASRVVTAPALRPLPPPIMVSTPPTESPDQGSSPAKPPYAANARVDDPHRPTPPAEIPSARPPLDLRAEMAERPREKTEKTSVAEDMLSAAKSVFHAVLPK